MMQQTRSIPSITPQTYAELLTPQQRRQLAAMHRAVARDRRVPKRDRERAAARANELERFGRGRRSD
jgi:hypothetical protein